jgi:hypothetical protein
MKQLNMNPKNIIIIILNILIAFIIIYSFFYIEKEGFTPNDLNKITSGIKDVTSVVGKLPNEINNVSTKLTKQITDIGSKIEKKTEEMGKEIEKKTVNVITVKLKSIFTQIGDMFNEGLIMPLLTMFTGIGNVFMQIFSIIKMIGNKIASLPGCIIVYAIQSTIDTIFYIYRKLIPDFVRSGLSFIYNYTFRYLFEFIGYITGYTDAVKSCYGFNVSTEVNKMNSTFNNIQKTFKDNFGNLNFSKIKV